MTLQVGNTTLRIRPTNQGRLFLIDRLTNEGKEGLLTLSIEELRALPDVSLEKPIFGSARLSASEGQLLIDHVKNEFDYLQISEEEFKALQEKAREITKDPGKCLDCEGNPKGCHYCYRGRVK